MGGEQAASVLATVKRDQLRGRGEEWSAEDEEAFKAPIREQYERQGNAYYATARLWDDGVIDPLETRQVLGLALTACANAPLGDPPLRRLPDVKGAMTTRGCMTMFDTVLVANRGEIAVRVIRTLRALGIRSVAVFTDADADARHVREADTAVRIGPAAAAESYLSVERLLEAAAPHRRPGRPPRLRLPRRERRPSRRRARTPGSSSSGRRPTPSRLMGDKIRAKETVQAAGVPGRPRLERQRPRPTPNSSPPAGRSASRCCSSRRAGGGGKGMRLVRDAGGARRRDRRAPAARPAPPSATTRCSSSGGSTGPRHIEIQVLADGHGQRGPPRRARVLPPAPPPEDHRGGAVSVLLDEKTRAAMGAAAVAGGALLRLRRRGHGRVHRPRRATRPRTTSWR